MVSEFNEEVTSRMLSVAEEKANLMKLKITYTCKVPGAYDMPIIVDSLLRKKNVDAVVTLGAIIKGQTKHDEVISHSAAKSLTDLSLQYKKTGIFRNFWSWNARKTRICKNQTRS